MRVAYIENFGLYSARQLSLLCPHPKAKVAFSISTYQVGPVTFRHEGVAQARDLPELQAGNQ